MSRKGIKNKRTLMREHNMKMAQAEAGLGGKFHVDSMEALKEALDFFRDHAKEMVKKRKKDEALKAFMLVAHVSDKINPYYYPKLTAVKVGGDRDNPLMISEGATGAEIRAELREWMKQAGVPEEFLKPFKPPPTIEGVANIAGKNGGGS